VPESRPGVLLVERAAVDAAGGAFVAAPGLDRPIYVRTSEAGYSAVLARCTHQGCQPEPVGDRLSCPCHGSEFAFTGEVLQGPASQPLVRFDVTTVGDRISIALRTGAGA
jgi:Rieske Fe-S protein